MKTVSFKIEESILEQAEIIQSELNQSRNSYLNDAIAHYNSVQRNQLLEKQLEFESNLVRENSMDVLRDFEEMDYGDQSI